MDKQDEIARLLSIRELDKHDIGLYGKAGIALFLFLYTRHSENKLLKQQAEQLLDEVVVDAGELCSSADFYTGITGIGWVIEYLSLNKLIDVDTDELLSDVDDVLFQARFHRTAIHKNEDTFGYGLYYLARAGCNTELLLHKQQKLSFLIEETEKSIFHHNFTNGQIPALNFHLLNSIFFFLLDSYRLGISPLRAKRTLLCLMQYQKAAIEKDFMDYSDGLVALQLLQDAFPLASNEKCYEDVHNIIHERMKNKNIMNNDISKLAWNNLMYHKNIVDNRMVSYINNVEVSGDMELADQIGIGLLCLQMNQL